MPELSRFHGMIIQMYFETGSRHMPHFHVRYGDARASFAFDPIVLLVGKLPTRQQRLVEAWAELHQAELKTSWARIQEHQSPSRIDPLR